MVLVCNFLANGEMAAVQDSVAYVQKRRKQEQVAGWLPEPGMVPGTVSMLDLASVHTRT